MWCYGGMTPEIVLWLPHTYEHAHTWRRWGAGGQQTNRKPKQAKMAERIYTENTQR